MVTFIRIIGQLIDNFLFIGEQIDKNRNLRRAKQMERIINYRDIPTDKKNDVLNALEQIGFFPAYGGVKTMQRVMENRFRVQDPNSILFFVKIS